MSRRETVYQPAAPRGRASVWENTKRREACASRRSLPLGESRPRSHDPGRPDHRPLGLVPAGGSLGSCRRGDSLGGEGFPPQQYCRTDDCAIWKSLELHACDLGHACGRRALPRRPNGAWKCHRHAVNLACRRSPARLRSVTRPVSIMLVELRAARASTASGDIDEGHDHRQVLGEVENDAPSACAPILHSREPRASRKRPQSPRHAASRRSPGRARARSCGQSPRRTR